MIRQRFEHSRMGRQGKSRAMAGGNRLRLVFAKSAPGFGWAAFLAAYGLIFSIVLLHGRFS